MRTPRKRRGSAPKLSDAEQKALTRLVRKHGVASIVAAIAEIPAEVLARTAGRPPHSARLSQLLQWEKMYASEEIERKAKEHADAGHPTPVKRAYIDFYQATLNELAQDVYKSIPRKIRGTPNPNETMALQTIRRLHRTGRRYWREYAADLRKRWKTPLPEWLEWLARRRGNNRTLFLSPYWLLDIFQNAIRYDCCSTS
jgi:hypothetical protein